VDESVVVVPVPVLETGDSTETSALSALRVFWARVVRISAEFEIPEVCMTRAVAKADSRRCSKHFGLMSGESWDKSVGIGYSGG
jgi:hypothetical protein